MYFMINKPHVLKNDFNILSIFLLKFYKFVFGVKRNTGAFISEEKDYVTETVQQLKEEVRATRRQYVSSLPVCLEVSLQSRCPCLHRICLCFRL